MALTLEDVDNIIKEAQPELLLRLKLNTMLLAKLRRADVVTESLDDALKVPTLTQHEKITKLLDHIKAGPVHRFLNFCKAIFTTNQRHLLEIMKVDIDAIDAQIASTCEGQSSAKTGCPPPAQERRFKQQRDYYKSKLAYSPIYQYATRSPLAHLDEIFTNIQLVDNQNDKGLTRHRYMWSNQRKVQLNDVFKVKGNNILSIILEGKPGNGKSTIMKKSAVDWARGKDEDRGSRYSGESPLREKDLIIFIDKHHEGETLDETIRNAIKGTHADKDDGLHFLRENPEKTFIFADGIDEFLRKEVREEIFKLAEDCQVNILVSCRQGHPYLDGKMNCFSRHVCIEGFKPEDSKAFVKSFMKVVNNDNNDGTVLHEMCEDLCSLLNREEMHKVYASPINCAFLCILYSSGEVNKDQLSSLTGKDLYARQQSQLLKREYAKVSDADDRLKVEMESETTIRGIHRMALHSLLHEEMKSSYSAEEAQKFGIDISSPAMVILQQEYEETVDGPKRMFCWPHQTIKEFHAANAAKDPAIMYVIASKPQLNEITKFLLSTLIDTEPEFVKELMKAVLLLQSETPSCVNSTWRKFKSGFSKQKHACCDIVELKQFVAEQDVNKLLQQEFTGTINVPKIQRLADIQNCQSGGDWVVKNESTFDALDDMVSDFRSASPLAEIVHPFLPSVLYGSLMKMMKTVQSDDDDDDDDGNDDEETKSILFNIFVRGTSTAAALLPSSSDEMFFHMVYINSGLPGRLLLNSSKGDPIDMDGYRVISILPRCIATVIRDIGHPFVRSFMKKCGRPDFIQIETEDSPTDKESEVWKNTIIECNKLFKPKKGIQTSPDCESILTIKDMKELTDLGVHLLNKCGHFILFPNE